MKYRVSWVLAVAAFAVVWPAAGQARVREMQMDVPVKLNDAYGKPIERAVKVTVFSDDTNPVPAPVLVLNHGRSYSPEVRAKLGRARYSEASRYFLSRGFIVAVPTRIGYGVTGGDDLEDSGTCSGKKYAPGYLAAAQQSLAVLDAVRQMPDAAKDRAVVMGQSYGGTTAVTVASLNPPGVQAAINFAGGGGGNPQTQPQRPCGPEKLERLFSSYGETARIPMLWIYTENDMYFGPRYPREWFDAYARSAIGVKSEFIQFPPHGDDGHSLFTGHPLVWQPRVGEFLDAVGFPAPTRSRAE